MFCNQHNSLFKMKYTFVKSQSSLREMRVGIPGLSFVFCKLVAVTLEKKIIFVALLGFPHMSRAAATFRECVL